jgi:predicted nucleic acid-binding protein
MMSRCLLDTDILSEIIKQRSAPVAARAAEYLLEQGRFTTSSMSVAEIVYGFRRMGRDDRVAQFEAAIDTAEVLPFDDAAGRLAGRINADLEKAGKLIGMPDVMIAAIALRNQMSIATGNVAHFLQVHSVGYEIVIDNWRG